MNHYEHSLVMTKPITENVHHSLLISFLIRTYKDKIMKMPFKVLIFFVPYSMLLGICDVN